jgi:dolichol-phosphate mannosyltransferase
LNIAVGGLLCIQFLAMVVLVRRLLPARHRQPPITPHARRVAPGSVSVIVATLNEAQRIAPLLDALCRQGPSMLEAIVVDSNSTDGTRTLISEAAARDARIRMITDDALPSGWIGKVWALQSGLQHARAPWVLGLDADTEPVSSLTDAVVGAATRTDLDVVSFAPQFAGQAVGERWLQPAMLVALVYRTGAPGLRIASHRLLANGQCFLCKRDVLIEAGGYGPAHKSFSDDVTLARHLSKFGLRVGFLDGSLLIQVRSYVSLRQLWTEWGRSFDLKDSNTHLRQAADVILIWLVQGLTLPLIGLSLVQLLRNGGRLWFALLAINALALGIRCAMLFALRRNYEARGLPFWMSWTADTTAAIRLTLSSVGKARNWRGRAYRC